MQELPTYAYPVAAARLKDVAVNHLFARSVIEQRVKGVVHVDKLEFPGVFHVKHSYGMSLVFGDPDALRDWDDFWAYIGGYGHSQRQDEWLQCWPGDACRLIDERIGSGNLFAERHTRLNFRFDRQEFLEGRKLRPAPGNVVISRTGQLEYDQVQGTVVPEFFWSDKDAFIRDGVGYTLSVEGAVASTAFSAFIHDHLLELGIETRGGYQGRGYAYEVCSHLIQYCLEQGFEPVWSCRLENTGSVKLAKKLGFQVTRELPYYRLLGNLQKDQSHVDYSYSNEP